MKYTNVKQFLERSLMPIRLKIFYLSLLIITFTGNSQELKSDIKPINKYLSLVKTKNGYSIVDNETKKSKEYTYVYLKDYGFIETIIVPPRTLNDSLRIKVPSSNRCYVEDNSIRQDFHVLELMKELKIIDNYTFIPQYELTWANIRDGKVPEFGCALKNGKYALVNNIGEILTDFKYNEFIEDNNKPIFNSFMKKGRMISVILDKFTGKEIFATKHAIINYWDSNNYVVKSKSGKYLLNYQSKEYKVSEAFSHLYGLPIESQIFTYSGYLDKKGGFIDLQSQEIKIDKQLIPLSNFYHGHCIALETITEPQKYNYYNEALPRKSTKTFKIINEKFETTKALTGITSVSSPFNKYGQCIVSGENNNSFVIDFNGNYIIQPSRFSNSIKEVYEGLYEVTDKSYPKTKESGEQENFYNQKGEKVINAETLKNIRSADFKVGRDENYLISYGYKFIVLGKDNTVLKSYY